MAKSQVLLVDDDKDLLQLLGELLWTRNFETSGAKNGEEALRLLEERSSAGLPDFSVVVSDWTMPVMGGVALLIKIRSSQFRGLPFVLTSGAVSPEELAGAIKYDADAVLLKPFSVDALCTKIDQAILSRQRKELDRAPKLQS